MKKAIEITKQEIKWHEENRSEAPTSAHADAFINGLKYLLDLFEQADASQPVNTADEESNLCLCPLHYGDCEYCKNGKCTSSLI